MFILFLVNWKENLEFFEYSWVDGLGVLWWCSLYWLWIWFIEDKMDDFLY